MDGFKPEPFTEREAFLWSIERAAWEDHEQWFNGHRIAVNRGEFVTSLRTMADVFGWTVKRVRGLMDRLGKAGKWAQRPAYQGAQAPTLLSVLNYNKYQELPRRDGTAPGTAKGKHRAQRGHSEGTQQNLKKPQETASTALEQVSPSASARAVKADDYPMPAGVDPQAWSDFLANRKRKRLPNTASAYKTLLEDLQLHTTENWPPARLIALAAGKGWASVRNPETEDNRYANQRSAPAGRPTPGTESAARRAAFDRVEL